MGNLTTELAMKQTTIDMLSEQVTELKDEITRIALERESFYQETVRQAGEIARLRYALRLGGHLRPGDGEVCDYIAGHTCNKCGWSDPEKIRLRSERDALGRILAQALTAYEDERAMSSPVGDALILAGRARLARIQTPEREREESHD